MSLVANLSKYGLHCTFVTLRPARTVARRVLTLHSVFGAQLLGELLLDRTNFNIMTKYISDASNLKLMMNLLRDKSKSIQFEAFHVFKVFVANPKKTRPIYDILSKNQDRLVNFLTNFQNEKGVYTHVLVHAATTCVDSACSVE
jgi:protein gp37